MERVRSHAIIVGSKVSSSAGATVRERAIGAVGKVALCRVFPCHCRVGPVVEDHFARSPGQKNT